MSFIDTPQRVWLRRAMFQVHLWVGVILALYFGVIGVSGSILVFREDIGRWMASPPPALTGDQSGARRSLDEIVGVVRERYPDKKIFSIRAPDGHVPSFVVYKEGGLVHVDPYNAEILGETTFQDTWLNWMARLHINLLSGRPGFIANGIGAVFLLALCISGAVIWWPGLKNWTRALKISMRSGWKRVNFDLHSAVGFWTLAWVSMWAVTTIYFVWPQEITRVIEIVSPVSRFPELEVPPRQDGPSPSLESVYAKARQMYPDDKLTGFVPPREDDDALLFQMARGRIGDFTQTDFVYFDPSTGEHLATYRRGMKHSLGDWIVWLMFPLHFGDDWGLAVKIIWAVTGLSLPLLAVTGLLMYWNRYLGKQWSKLRSRPRSGVALPRS